MPPVPLAPPAADRVLAHLDREEALLTHLRGGLAALHAALRGADPSAVADAQTSLAILESEAAALGPARAALLGGQSPANARLADLLVPLPAPVATRLNEVRVLAAEVDQLRRRCAALLVACRSFAGRLRVALMAGDGPRYGPAGTALNPSRPGRLLARG